VVLTPRGHRVINKIMNEKKKSIRAMFGVVSAGERRQCLSVLQKVAKSIMARTAVAALVLLSFASQARAEDQPLTLRQAYEYSLKQSEVVAQQVQELESAKGDFYSALQYILPNVHFVMTHFEQDAPRKGEGGSSSGDGASSNLSRRTTPGAKFTFSQPIFSGFKEFAAIRASGSLTRERKFQIQRAKEVLFIDVVDAFYETLWKEKTVEVHKNIKTSIEDRLKELNERAKVGRTRESEIQTATSDLKTVEAAAQKAQREYVVAKQLLEFYIGREIKGPLADEDIPLLNLGDVFRFLEARDKRADVLAAKENYHLYQANVMSAQSGFFPWVTLDGNYYTRRVGFQSGIDWDVVLTVDVPIFDGMQTVGATKKAYAEQEIARLEYELVRRQADLEIRNFFETYHAMQDEDKALKEAVDAAKSTYDIQSQDYRTNLVNNLDVLDALRRSEDSQNSWLETHFDMKRSYWKFKVSVGEAP
jgi:outer membrane protein